MVDLGEGEITAAELVIGSRLLYFSVRPRMPKPRLSEVMVPLL